MDTEKKYSDVICEWLKHLGYTHCFFVAGGNIMHLLESANKYFKCIPTVHEIAVGIATEYFNETECGKKAFALITAGPGFTNIVTAIGGAYLESRELLVIGGQVKTSDLSYGQNIRQRGIQEIAGVDIARPITKKAVCLYEPLSYDEFAEFITLGSTPRKGPVFIEFPLDIQACIVNLPGPLSLPPVNNESQIASLDDSYLKDSASEVARLIRTAKRPIILIGGGVKRETVNKNYDSLDLVGVPIMTTWNGADRIGADHALYFGRPNTWGQRYANVLIQESDLLVAIGTRLGLQQTGFNWQEFVPKGRIVQVDCDEGELAKGHPVIFMPICGDANIFLELLLKDRFKVHSKWIKHCEKVKELLPVEETINVTGKDYISPYRFSSVLSKLCSSNDVIIPCSSGGASTTTMQAFAGKKGQVIINNKSLASMGYGLSGAIGAAIALSPRRTILIEGDGGFAQNLQELGTVVANGLNLKIFIFDDCGYASIRMTQKSYFGGNYFGCDNKTGLGLPNWEKLFAAYDIPFFKLPKDFGNSQEFSSLFNSKEAVGFIVPIDPAQTYFPKITSKILANGSMKSNPLNLMTPDIDEQVINKINLSLREIK